tara:strand:- start:762 stop:2066 length:1305 start_codon:yes stop_codon:yes gene_type:complete
MDLYGIDEAISQGNAPTRGVEDYNQRVRQTRDIIMNNFDQKEALDKSQQTQDELTYGIHDIADLGGAGLSLDKYSRILSRAYADSGNVDADATGLNRLYQSLGSIYRGQRELSTEVNPLLGGAVNTLGQGLGKFYTGTANKLSEVRDNLPTTLNNVYQGLSDLTDPEALANRGLAAEPNLPQVTPTEPEATPTQNADAGTGTAPLTGDDRTTPAPATSTLRESQGTAGQVAQGRQNFGDTAPPPPAPDTTPPAPPSDTGRTGATTTPADAPTEEEGPKGFFEKYGEKIDTAGQFARVGQDIYGGIDAYETLKSGLDTKDKLDETSQIAGMIGTGLDVLGVAVPILEPLGEVANLVSLGAGEVDDLEKDFTKTATTKDPSKTNPAPVGSDQAREQQQLSEQKLKVNPATTNLNQVGLIASRQQHLGANSGGVSTF